MNSRFGHLIRLGNRDERDVNALILFLTVAAVACVLMLGVGPSANVLWQLVLTLALTTVIAMVIWQACDPFAEAAQWIGKRFRIPASVRGATLDAMASSMPELFSGIFFVTVAIAGTQESQQRLIESTQGFGSSIAICAGSSIYNLMLIPAVCAIVIASVRPARPQIEFSSEVVHRDGAWVIASQIGLLVILFLPRLYWWMALIWLAAYAVYVCQMYLHARSNRRQTESFSADELPKGTPFLFGMFYVRFSGLGAMLTIAIATLTAAVSCYFLVELTNHSARVMGIPPFFVAVILAAAASSIPDTFVSIGSARRGDDSGAISNVFGSNIFDICIGMSIPLLVCCYLNDWKPLDLVKDNQETIQGVAALRVLLFILSSIAMYLLWTHRRISRRMGYFFCALYLVFVGYAILGSMNVI